MRKISYALFILSLLALVVLTGCGRTETKQPAPAQQKSTSSYNSAPVTTTLIQGQPSGVLMMISNGLAECLNKSYPGSVIHTIPGDPVSNTDRLIKGEADFVMTFNSTAYAAIKGEGGTPHPEIKGVAALKSSPMQFVLVKDKNALTFDDILKKKIKIKINIDEPNSPSHKLFDQMVNEYGLTQSDMEGWGCVFLEKYEQSEIEELYSSGIIDGYFCTVAAPHTMIMQNAQDRETVLIAIDPKVIDALCKSFGYEQATVPAGTYPFLKQDYCTLTDYTILATTDKVSDETVYKMARSIHQNLDYLRLVHASLKNLDEKRMIEKLEIPIHDGAYKYYKEEGLVE